MNTYTDRIAKRNEMQKEYAQAKKETLELARKIERAILDMPAAAENWAYVGDIQYLRSQLQEIRDRLYGLGEYAS